MPVDWQMIRLEKEGPIAVVSLTNPPLNVLHPQMVEELAVCFAALADDPEVLVAIVTGDGERAFCAGFDIKEFPGLLTPGRAEKLAARLHAGLGAIENLGKPTIAAVNGLALGGGMEVRWLRHAHVAGPTRADGATGIKLGLCRGRGPQACRAGRAVSPRKSCSGTIGAEEATASAWRITW